ncbi:UNVERIFIED_CONTAM: phosphotransferase system enzyme I (PtsI) [Brevibacillus sp. OAP136]
MMTGIGASDGIAVGKALVKREQRAEFLRVTIDDERAEKARFRHAIHEASNEIIQIRDVMKKKGENENAQIFDAHLMMLDDPEFVGQVEELIETESVNAEYALQTVASRVISMFESMENGYMKERAADIRDIQKRLKWILQGEQLVSPTECQEEIILVCNDLTPSETAQLDRTLILGIVTEAGGKTSHTAILARSYEIPAVVGLHAATKQIESGDLLIIDGAAGEVIVRPSEEMLAAYTSKKAAWKNKKAELLAYKDALSVTKDGKRVEVAANIGSLHQVEGVLANGAEGIGLFRTEFLFMDRETIPSEEEQFHAYQAILEKMGDRPVVFRTLDIGGDKQLSYLPIAQEMNPFLGYRAIRLCLDRQDIFATQIRAILRASVYGKAKLMFPMISSLQELRQAKAVLHDVKCECREKGIAFDEEMEIGIMIEVPSAAIISDVLAKEVDFFSIGTNDLLQYTLAVDRMNEKITRLYDPFHPAILRLIRAVIANGHKEGICVGMCGEMAGDTRMIPVFLGMGLDEFSMSASLITQARKTICELDMDEARRIAETVLQMDSSDQILDYLQLLARNHS